MPRVVLFKPEIVLEIYLSTINEHGQGSARKTAEILGEKGYLNPNTHKPITKQAVLECLRKMEEGKEALRKTAKNKWRSRY